MHRLLAALLVLTSSAAWGQIPQTPPRALGEFQVNTSTADHQYFPAAAFDREGDFVVVWSSYRGAAALTDVVAQRFDAGGTRIGAEFVVNATTTSFQYTNAIGTPVAMRPDGRFVVVWTETIFTNNFVRGQRFEADGTPSGNEFAIAGLGDSYYPNVAVAPHGTFVVVWAGDTPSLDIIAQRFDAAGNPIGVADRVNTSTLGVQTQPRVAMAASGAFVVVWQDRAGLDGSGHGVFARRYDAAGQPIGAQFQVNTTTTGNQYAYSVSAAPDGRFVVSWDGPGDGDRNGLFAQRYDAAGVPSGGEFVVNASTTGSQTYGAIAADAGFRLAGAWQSTAAPGDSSGFGIRGLAFNADGSPRGDEFLVNTYTTFSQQAANVAVDEVGNFVVLWQSDRQDGSDLGVFAQRYRGLHPRGVEVDRFRNGVAEPGEIVRFDPTWANTTAAQVMFAGVLGEVQGPPGGEPILIQDTAIYEPPAGQQGACTICPLLEVPAPSPRPAVHWDGSFAETIGAHWNLRKRWLLHVGESFTDVPASNPFYRFIETLLHHSVTGGCTATEYCPLSDTSREQMAVFVLVAKEGVGYAPPACAAPRFNDVPAASPFCRWIEELARRGVVFGCAPSMYCPSSPVRRDQMAVFVLRTHEPALTPPACGAPLFADVPASSPFCPYVEELARRGVVTGCGGGNYCPSLPVTREQMGVFISGTFGLTLYGL